MSETTVILLIQLFFWGLAILALISLARFRDGARLDIALVMLSIALALTPPHWYNNISLLQLTPSTLALIAHPYLLLRLVRHFRQIRPLRHRLAVAGMALSAVALAISPNSTPILLFVLAYMIGIEGYAIVAFFRTARVSSGVSRWRLLLVALAILTLLLAIVTFIPFRNSQTENPFILFIPITLIIVAGGAFYLGFAPPRWLRKYWQLRELNQFLHSVPAQYADMDLAHVIGYLCHAAQRSVDSITAVAAMLNEEENALTINPPDEFPQLAGQIPAETGRIGRAWLKSDPFYAASYSELGQFGLRQTVALGAKGILVVPIRTALRPFGLLLVFCRQMPLFVEDDLDLLSLMTMQTARTLSYSHLLVSERKARTHAEILAQTAARLSVSIKLEQTLETICDETLRATQQSFAAIFAPNRADGRWQLWHGKGRLDALQEVSQPLSATALAQLQRQTTPLLLQIFSPSADWPAANPLQSAGVHSLAVAPLLYKQELIGMLAIGSMEEVKPIAEAELNLLQGIADQAAMAVQNGRLYRAINDYNDELESRVAQRTADLEARNEELDAFAHTVAHDLKMPITHMVGLAETLASKFETLPESDRQRYLEIIQQSGQKMANIIDALLLLAGVREMDVPITPLDMGQIVEEARQRLAHLNWQHGVTINLPDTWPQAVGYAPWVEEIWINYLSNGIKYGGHPPQLTVGATPLANNMIKFWVQDNGIGIIPEMKEKLFVPFTQLNLYQDSGYGLGLSIVQRIVERLGGSVGAESQPENGGLFWFTLPAAQTAATVQIEPDFSTTDSG